MISSPGDSIQCKILGSVFTLSGHGSLLMVALVSLTRCYKCVFERTVRVRKIVPMAGISYVMIVIESVLPVLPVSELKDIFRASMSFKDNPFITEYKAACM